MWRGHGPRDLNTFQLLVSHCNGYVFNNVFFLAHLSRRLKWAIVIALRPSSVRPSVVVVRPLTFHIFDFSCRTAWLILIKLGRYEVLMVPYKCCCFFGQIRPGADPGRGKNRSQGVPFFKKLLQTRRLQRQTKCITSARYSKGWIQGGAKIGRGRASPLTKFSFRPNVHSNILMYCRQHCRHVHLFESWLNYLLLVIRWAIKGPWSSS